MNPMRNIRIEKLTLNIGAGKDTVKLEKGTKLLEIITGIKPVKTFTRKRIPNWGLRPGLPIGCKLTLRKEAARQLLLKLLKAKENRLAESNFDEQGNISFGIPEYIDIPDVGYSPEIGIMGLQVCVTLERPGFRIRRRATAKKKIPPRHRIRKEESIDYLKKGFGAVVE